MSDHILTWRQRRVLQAISEITQRQGYPPTFREIAEEAGMSSTSGVSHQISVLQKQGYLRRDGHRQRALVLVKRPAA